jgi:putative ABC transport system permease protein
MGLLGLCAFSTYQRTKEIGIRRVLGANGFHVAWSLSVNFFKPIIIAMIIACPVAWILMNQWLQNNYAYRITVDWWMFISASAIALIIAALTISYYIFKSLKANPIKSLRQE